MMAPLILVIDDEWLNRELFEGIFDANNLRSIMAADGKTGIYSAQEHQPDLILVDVRMPVMNGYEVCQQLKADAGTAQIPVALISGLENTSTERAKASAAGALDLIPRGLPIDKFIERIRPFLPDD